MPGFVSAAYPDFTDRKFTNELNVIRAQLRYEQRKRLGPRSKGRRAIVKASNAWLTGRHVHVHVQTPCAILLVLNLLIRMNTYMVLVMSDSNRRLVFSFQDLSSPSFQISLERCLQKS